MSQNKENVLSKKVTLNQPSSLLTDEENNAVFVLLPRRSVSLSTAVVQLLLTESPMHKEWNLSGMGIACFVKNNNCRSYFIQVFDSGDKIFDQELYTNINYETPLRSFHFFEADSCMAGLNFADEGEADSFKTVVQSKLNLRQPSYHDKKANNTLPVPVTTVRSRSLDSLDTKQRLSRRRGLTKEDIGMPSNFVHLQHVGWNSDTGFDVNNVDPKLEKFLMSAKDPISKDWLHQEDTRKFILDFIEEHGGIDTVLQQQNEEIKQNAEIFNSRSPRTQKIVKDKPPAPPRPPPPSSPQVTPPNIISGGSKASSTPMLQSSPPPPPPPPPPPISPSVPLSQSLDEQSLLSNNCKVKETKSAPNQLANTNSREALLNQIKLGTQLKPMKSRSHETKSSPKIVKPDSLADALSKALNNRFKAQQSCHSDSSDECSTDNEWE